VNDNEMKSIELSRSKLPEPQEKIRGLQMTHQQTVSGTFGKFFNMHQKLIYLKFAIWVCPARGDIQSR